MFYNFEVKDISDGTTVDTSMAASAEALFDFCDQNNYLIGDTHYIFGEPIEDFKQRCVLKAREFCHEKIELIAPSKMLMLAALDVSLDADTKKSLKATARDFDMCCRQIEQDILDCEEDIEGFTHIDTIQEKMNQSIWPTQLVLE